MDAMDIKEALIDVMAYVDYREDQDDDDDGHTLATVMHDLSGIIENRPCWTPQRRRRLEELKNYRKENIVDMTLKEAVGLYKVQGYCGVAGNMLLSVCKNLLAAIPDGYTTKGEYRPPRIGEWLITENAENDSEPMKACINFRGPRLILYPIAVIPERKYADGDKVRDVDDGEVCQVTRGMWEAEKGEWFYDVRRACFRRESALVPTRC